MNITEAIAAAKQATPWKALRLPEWGKDTCLLLEEKPSGLTGRDIVHLSASRAASWTPTQADLQSTAWEIVEPMKYKPFVEGRHFG